MTTFPLFDPGQTVEGKVCTLVILFSILPKLVAITIAKSKRESEINLRFFLIDPPSLYVCVPQAEQAQVQLKI